MSVSFFQHKITGIQREIQNSQRKLADLSRDEASLNGRIASINRNITKSTTASILEMNQREIQRLQENIARLQDSKARVSKDIADKTEKLHRAQQELFRQQAKEQQRILDTIARRSRARDRMVLNEINNNIELNRSGSIESMNQYHAFVSHATEDKDDIVRPLAELLQALGYKIWYDEFQLRVGDSLRRSIDRGLSSSKFGIVVLSPSFFEKNWPQYELDGLVAKEMVGGKVILPLWHKVSKNEVMSYSPTLADKIALSTATLTIEELAKALSEVLGDV